MTSLPNSDLLGNVTWLIGYTPLGDEPDYRTAPEFVSFIPDRLTLVTQHPEDDPFVCAAALTQSHTGSRPALLIPGRAFDANGTRHGRGGGWYDRFLSKVPVSWLRIGIATPDTYTSTLLTREAWDEPVDVVLIQEPDGWRHVHTNARGDYSSESAMSA